LINHSLISERYNLSSIQEKSQSWCVL